MDTIAAELESGMQLLGITAIEDRLQDEVPECIAAFIKAGIVVWMLTGDKEETAVQIAGSCNLIHQNTKSHYITKVKHSAEFYDIVKKTYDTLMEADLENEDHSLIIDGPSLNYFDEESPEQRAWMLDIGQACKSVVGCRLSPLQKQMVVNLVKTDAKPSTITLAIGDGANDVPMIRAANVGIGIIGKEGRRAANNSDFAIGQFRFLKRLMFVHGRNNYMRQANSFLYSIHKNLTLTLTLFWYSYFDALSGTSMYESNVYTGFNLMLGLPIIIYGFTNKDVADDFAMKQPLIYASGRTSTLLGVTNYLMWGSNAGMFALMICISSYYTMEQSFQEYGVYEFGTHVFLSLVFALQLKVCFLHHSWNVLHVGSMTLSIFGTFAYILAVNQLQDFQGEADSLYGRNLFWLMACFGIPIFCILIDLIGQAIYMFISPPFNQMVVEKFREEHGLNDAACIDVCGFVGASSSSPPTLMGKASASSTTLPPKKPSSTPIVPPRQGGRRPTTTMANLFNRNSGLPMTNNPIFGMSRDSSASAAVEMSDMSEQSETELSNIA